MILRFSIGFVSSYSEERKSLPSFIFCFPTNIYSMSFLIKKENQASPEMKQLLRVLYKYQLHLKVSMNGATSMVTKFFMTFSCIVKFLLSMSFKIYM